mmetsp:Transcript_20124/g.46668  ORF Transcript_20124/g.46668 Transcript_20124/m.46668 type:complete len:111 (-) Transcript_20124:219-551(-)
MTSRRPELGAVIWRPQGARPSWWLAWTASGCREINVRGEMISSRPRETIACPWCEHRLARKNMDAHVAAAHLGSAAQLLRSAWRQNAVWEERHRMLRSEQRHASALPGWG